MHGFRKITLVSLFHNFTDSHYRLVNQLYHRVYRQILSWINRFIWSDHAILSQYVPHPIAIPPDLGYILIECIELNRGRMLSDTWANYLNNITLRTTLFQGLACIMLSLARVPLPKIGSFVIDKNGFILLSNRPLTPEIQQLENDEIPINIYCDYTYLTIDSYITDISNIFVDEKWNITSLVGLE
ncbi:hypothetical protein MGYG_08291 [Nannizzia gypsea CBS 118893]|uniref:Uncharacterized protein n=1 Tax=Arthroderma gypseum (strain ATCC MYA-4604 / CBS 118893) TaxID=535722 RepID=E4V697_ARTGP|nr:hypothetical protein MGYG_08291 [Nannizzia gypsea CBS 118893]EFR05280.1 hypothetical protein MGYG_08291 [Nannizzia gypsea CBS 118893]